MAMDVRRWFQDLPLARKLITIGVATTASTLLVACVTILAYDISSSRVRLAREVELLADVVGANSTAAVAFRDQTTAGEILSAWRAAERRLVELPAMSPERDALETEIAAFRARYQRLFPAR